MLRHGVVVARVVLSIVTEAARVWWFRYRRRIRQRTKKPVDEEKVKDLNSAEEHHEHICNHPNVIEVRPKELECDVVRFQNNKEKWVAFVGLLEGYPYEIFTGLQDDEEGIAPSKRALLRVRLSSKQPKTAVIVTTSSLRISVVIRLPLRACQRSSTQSIGTMRSWFQAYCVIVCQSTTWSSSLVRCSWRTKASILGRMVLNAHWRSMLLMVRVRQAWNVQSVDKKPLFIKKVVWFVPTVVPHVVAKQLTVKSN